MTQSMMRSGMCSAALALLLVCLALTSNAEAGRTHELFAQNTYYEQPTTTDEKAAAVVAEALKNDNLPGKTTTSTTATAQASIVSVPQEAAVSTDNGTPHDPESARAESNSTLVDLPKKPQQEEQHYRDYRGTTPAQGDFIPDARPWWSNPQYANNVRSRNPELDHQSKPNIANIPTTPNRYPMGYPTQHMGPEFYYSQSSNPANAHYSAIHNGQYSSTMDQQQQYVPNRFPQYTSNVPYEMTSGGCPTQYWISNTHRWPAFFTVKTTVGDALGTPASKVFGQTTLLQALLNTRPDGYSTLLRSAATAILNAYTRSQYKYTHVNVIESFAAALSNSTAAAEQAASFEEANVSAYREQYNSCA